MRPCLLLTRPHDAAERFAKQLGPLSARFELIRSPLTEIVFPSDLPSLSDRGADPGGLIFTSRYGVAGFLRASDRRDLPVWCVGPGTAQAAREAGFDQVTQGDGDGEALVKLLIKARPGGTLLHLRGAHVAVPLAERFSDAGLHAREQVVYLQRDCALNDVARSLLCSQRDVIVPLFSPRSAALFARALQGLDGLRARRHYVAISAAAADAMEGEHGHAPPVMAPSPDAAGMRLALEACIDELEQSAKPR